MIEIQTNIQAFLASLPGFSHLPPRDLAALAEKLQWRRYRIGQSILRREQMPAQVTIVYQGQVRLLGYEPYTQALVTLKLLGVGEICGWASLARGIACETAIASTETICLALPGVEFLAWLEASPQLRVWGQQQCFLVEIFELLGAELGRQAAGGTNLKQLALAAEATPLYLPPGKLDLSQLDGNKIWFVSNHSIPDLPPGSRVDTTTGCPIVFKNVRLVGFSKEILDIRPTEKAPNLFVPADIAYAQEPAPAPLGLETYPYISGEGSLAGAIACCQMLSQHLDVPWRRDLLRRVFADRLERSGDISLQFCGAVAELMGLQGQLVNLPAATFGRLPVPALITWRDSLAIVYAANEKELILGIPAEGIRRRSLLEFAEIWGTTGQVLLLQRSHDAPKAKFGLSWFLPALERYRRVLIEVFIASFVVQLFGLANPLVTQVIIDTVLTTNSLDTLHILGTFLVIVAIFEAVLTSLRTYLFVDTTNRIDLSLGAEIIDHLLRLPLRYFERRPVGELASRINELENIRQFLTGTALTVVLDAIFSAIYIVVMVFYSWILTLVALAVLPLFGLLALVFSPIVRRRLRNKAESYSQTQSYLVEVLSGISTVKAQNIELRSRWQWQELYSRYISSGFQAVIISTATGATSNFLSKLSNLLVLWVGAYLVLQKQMTLGELIAFRIIAGYVTSPLLRLAQLWQNFQETALSLDRLSDILDAPPEADASDRHNIPMPTISGTVKYENITFRFAPSGAPQLLNINLEIPAGTFVGIVGQSGSGKSTLTKLLTRLYEPNSGRILVDNYDISKVELYSLRRQIGIVPQDTLLFDGTVQENIALTNPDAAIEDIIAAAKIAVAHDFIMALPNGYNTRVGERGSTLSGGQRQRIAIARTILQNPHLLILDEATSALDYDSERQVCLNLAQEFQGRTVFFITHRLTTIRNSDVILMMAQGAIVEQGTHAELMALKGRYYCLYKQQEFST